MNPTATALSWLQTKNCPSASDDVCKYVILRRTIDVAEKGVDLCIGYKLQRAVHGCDSAVACSTDRDFSKLHWFVENVTLCCGLRLPHS